MLLVLDPAGLPRTDLIRLGNAPLAAAVGVTLLAVVLVGVLPALAAAQSDLASPLRIDVRSGSETRARRQVRRPTRPRRGRWSSQHRSLWPSSCWPAPGSSREVSSGCSGSTSATARTVSRCSGSQSPSRVLTPKRNSALCWTGFLQHSARFPASPRSPPWRRPRSSGRRYSTRRGRSRDGRLPSRVRIRGYRSRLAAQNISARSRSRCSGAAGSSTPIARRRPRLRSSAMGRLGSSGSGPTRSANASVWRATPAPGRGERWWALPATFAFAASGRRHPRFTCRRASTSPRAYSRCGPSVP